MTQKPRQKLTGHLEKRGITGADNKRLVDFLIDIFSKLNWLFFLMRKQQGLERTETPKK